jgi:hypothetical protein
LGLSAKEILAIRKSGQLLCDELITRILTEATWDMDLDVTHLTPMIFGTF